MKFIELYDKVLQEALKKHNAFFAKYEVYGYMYYEFTENSRIAYPDTTNLEELHQDICNSFHKAKEIYLNLKTKEQIILEMILKFECFVTGDTTEAQKRLNCFDITEEETFSVYKKHYETYEGFAINL